MGNRVDLESHSGMVSFLINIIILLEPDSAFDASFEQLDEIV